MVIFNYFLSIVKFLNAFFINEKIKYFLRAYLSFFAYF